MAGPALLGSCLVSLRFLCNILSGPPVPSYDLSNPNFIWSGGINVCFRGLLNIIALYNMLIYVFFIILKQCQQWCYRGAHLIVCHAWITILPTYLFKIRQLPVVKIEYSLFVQ